MEVKLFDVRDVGTEMGAFAIRLEADNELEQDILNRRGGFGRGMLIVGTLGPAPIEATYDRFHWQTGEHVRTNATMFRAHRVLEHRWDELSSGDLIDLGDPRNALE